MKPVTLPFLFFELLDIVTTKVNLRLPGVYEANLFMGGISNGWITNASALPQSIGYKFVVARTIVSYSILGWFVDNFPGRCPHDWLFQGSNDGANYNTLHTVTDFSTWSSTVYQAFTPSLSGLYLYYRLYITANMGNAYTGIGQLRLFVTSTTLGLYVRTPVATYLLSK